MASNLPVVQVIETPPQGSGPIALARDCEATRIPSGAPARLAAGTRVEIAQSLGGQFTVTTDDGGLFRIAGKDADALGQQPAAAATATAEGPFESDLLDHVAREPQMHLDLVAAERVHPFGAPVGPLRPAEVARLAAVVDDDLLIQIAQLVVHRKISWTLCNPATSASTSERRL